MKGRVPIFMRIGVPISLQFWGPRVSDLGTPSLNIHRDMGMGVGVPISLCMLRDGVPKSLYSWKNGIPKIGGPHICMTLEATSSHLAIRTTSGVSVAVGEVTSRHNMR